MKNPIASLQPALITSACQQGMIFGDRKRMQQAVGATFRSFGRGRPQADLYLFLREEARSWSRAFVGRKLPRVEEKDSGFEFIAALETGHIRSISESIHEWLLELGIQPVAITSFIPEISLAPTLHTGWSFFDRQVQGAIENLLRFAVAFGRRMGNRTPVVQMVAGSRISGIRKTLAQGGEAAGDDVLLEAQVAAGTGAAGFHMIENRLKQAFQKVRNEIPPGQTEEREALDRVRIAVELEPGPLFLLNGPRALIEFCSVLDRSTSNDVKRRVGLNLDIPHWMLARITPEWLREHSGVEQRIFHAHVSGHSQRAHFGDFSLRHVDDSAAGHARSWLAELKRLAASPDAAGNFSGFVSLEFEVPPDPDAVWQSVEALIEML